MKSVVSVGFSGFWFWISSTSSWRNCDVSIVDEEDEEDVLVVADDDEDDTEVVVVMINLTRPRPLLPRTRIDEFELPSCLASIFKRAGGGNQARELNEKSEFYLLMTVNI